MLDYHPFNVVGWDGFVYPWTFNIADFEPKSGRLHQPPPAHQTFEGPGFVICSFCPRNLEWDPQAVPIPYNHSNLQSDEMIYYVSGNFESRKGIEVGSITLHPYGIPHGPQPGLAEKALGATCHLGVGGDVRHLPTLEARRLLADHRQSGLHVQLVPAARGDPGRARDNRLTRLPAMQLGMIGLGRMGANLVRRLMRGRPRMRGLRPQC